MNRENKADFALSLSGVRIVKLQQTNGSLEIWNEALNSIRKRIQGQTDITTLKERLGKHKKLFRMGRERLSEKKEQRLWQILLQNHHP